VRTLLGEMDIAGALVTADAAHTCAGTARYLARGCRADYLLTIKGNGASLHAAAITTCRDLAAAEPGHIAEERGHGRINRWTTWTTHTDPTAWARIGLPHATRRAVIRRDVADLAGQPLSKELVFVATSRADLTAAEISAHTQRHWGSRIWSTGPATPSGARTTSRPTTATAPEPWPPCATWPSACSPSTAPPRSNRPSSGSAATRSAPSH
jgi:hypothetical protein